MLKPTVSLLLAISATSHGVRASRTLASITPSQWASFNQSISGRLHRGYPVAKPCYSSYNGSPQTPDVAQCLAVQSGYTNESYVASQYGGYVNTNFGFCQKNAQGCDLDFNAPFDPSYYLAPGDCHQGSVPMYYVDVRAVSDVQATLKFVHDTGIAMVIKNSGDDYKGRSSAPDTLALWTHNYQPALTLQRNFVPDGCTKPAAHGVIMGAGQGFGGIYEFAEANNITIVGGSSRTVGAVGG